MGRWWRSGSLAADRLFDFRLQQIPRAKIAFRNDKRAWMGGGPTAHRREDTTPLLICATQFKRYSIKESYGYDGCINYVYTSFE
jgi:hypothetical protein